MTPLRALFVVAFITFVILICVAAFNFKVDPMCSFHCTSIEPQRKTLNYYYRNAQKIAAHPKTKLIVLGSSRGETTPPHWLEKATGLESLNLSIGAAELMAKIAFLNIALEKTRLTHVIWWADYFELIPQTIDGKMKNTPSLRSYVEKDFIDQGLAHVMPAWGDRIIPLIDHNTLEASFYALNGDLSSSVDLGSGSDIDYLKCEKADYAGERTSAQVQKELDLTYDTYIRKIFKDRQSDEELRVFVSKMKHLSQMGIKTTIIIPPYHPAFSKRLAREFPEIYEAHWAWIRRLEALDIPNVKIVNAFGGLRDSDETPKYWNDGVHFTCKGAIQLLKTAIEPGL